MRLTATQVEQTLNQFEAEALPDNHPVISQLNSLFGDHTFFLDNNGLNIVEPVEPSEARAEARVQKGQVVNIASWNGAEPQYLEPHEPEQTDVIVTLGPKH